MNGILLIKKGYKMLIWGWTTKNTGQVVTDWVCSHCQQDGLVMVTFQKFFTLFFVPAIPLNKTQVLVCCACSTEYNPKALGIETKDMPAAKTPIWGFAGPIIIVLLIALSMIFGAIDSNKKEQYLASPQVNDVVIYKDMTEKKTPYVCLKIQEVKDGIVIFKESRYAYSHLKGVREVALKSDNGEAFFEDVFEMPISNLKQLDVVSIER